MSIFGGLNIHPSLIAALEKQGITTPTQVQVDVVPAVLQNKDLIVQSETGTGKTLAYLLPLFEKIDPSKREMQVLVLTPTHELAMQVLRQVELLSEYSEIKATATAAIGNVNIERQIEKLREKPNIVAGTPGRVLELIKRKKITAHTIKTIVMDEADTLLSKDNLELIRSVIKSTLKDRQLLTFSATITKDAEEYARELMKDPEIIRTTVAAAVPETIEHIYFLTELRDKIETLRKAIAALKPQRAMVFIGDREETEFTLMKLQYHGIKAAGMHGHADKMERKRSMDAFRSGAIQVLVVSDIAARGLDVEDVTHIFNLNIPEKPKDYLHRVGRTGRKGKPGMAVSFVTERELQFIRQFEKDLKIKIAPKLLSRGQLVDVGRGR